MGKIDRLQHRIDIWEKAPFINELDENDYKDEKITTIWAKIVPQTGSLQKTQAETILSNTTHKIIVRYGAGKDIKESDFIMFRGKRFDIKFILNPYFKNELLEIFAEQIIE